MTRFKLVVVEGEIPSPKVDQLAPLRRCADCEHDLGEPLAAAFLCPLFGRSRAGVAIRCRSFAPRALPAPRRSHQSKIKEKLMENQHQQITGYRDLTQEEIDAMNQVKALANGVGALCNKLAAMAKEDPTKIDPRWVAIGQTDLQKGFMSLVRSIARPTSF